MKIQYILFICFFSLYGCGNDWLDLSPNTSVDSDKAITALSDVEFAANGLYDTMQSSNYYGDQMTYYGDLTADDMRSYKTTSTGASYYQFKYHKENATNSFWSVYYSIAKNVAIALESMDKLDIQAGKEFITPSGRKTTEDKYYNENRGQILAIRALALFDMTRLYGYPYQKDQGASLGVPIVKSVVDKDSKPVRNTVKECYDAILEDLNESLQLINEERYDGKLNKWAVLNLISRIYLYMGENEKALAAAEEGLAGAKQYGFALATHEEYPLMWAKPFNNEFLFEIVNLTTDSPGKNSIGYHYRKFNMIATTSFFKNYLAKSEDIRKSVVSTDSSSKPYCDKFPEQEGKSFEDCNVVVFRMSELYLNAAEAAVKLENQEKAALYFLPIYARTNIEWDGRDITLADVLEQRRIEFWGEGHRFFDLLRNNLRVERTDYLESVATDARSFDWDFYRIVLPIPRKETNLNGNITQNPGYGD